MANSTNVGKGKDSQGVPAPTDPVSQPHQEQQTGRMSTAINSNGIENPPTLIRTPTYPAISASRPSMEIPTTVGVSCLTADSSIYSFGMAHQPVHTASQPHGLRVSPLASLPIPFASSPMFPPIYPYTSSLAAQISEGGVDPRLLTAPGPAESAFNSSLPFAGTTSGMFGPPAIGHFADGPPLQARAVPPYMSATALDPNRTGEATNTSYSSTVHHTQPAPRAGNPNIPHSTVTPVTSKAPSELLDVFTAASFSPATSLPSRGNAAVSIDPCIADLAPATTNSVIVGSLVTRPVAPVWSILSPSVSASFTAGTHQEQSKRKRVVKAQAAAVDQPASGTAGETGDYIVGKPAKKRPRKSCGDAGQWEFTQNHFGFAPSEQPLATMSVFAVVLSSSPAATSDATGPNCSTSLDSDAVQNPADVTGPIWHSAAPGMDLSGPPVLTGPDDPDSDVQPAPEGTKYPPQGATLKLCKLPWAAGTVLLWEDIPLERQLRAVRRFRLRFPWASWKTAEAYISLKCRKQKSEKQRQEDKKANRKAARDARISSSRPSTTGPRAGPAFDTGSLPAVPGFSGSIAASPSPATANALGSLVAPATDAYGSTSLTVVSSHNTATSHVNTPVSPVSFNVHAAGLAFEGSGGGFGQTNSHHDGLIHSGLFETNASASVESPLFLPFDGDDIDEEENMDDWPEAFLSYLRATIPGDPIIDRFEEMNARDQQAARNLALSPYGTYDVAVRQLTTTTPLAPSAAAGANASDAHGESVDDE
ncbi:hypothetical protein BZA77DRAFT_356489 [Pyronema omphalodes]|nr:hypothetical protein BZA77DRAFT_356489 [Pyronema omphalodes]